MRSEVSAARVRAKETPMFEHFDELQLEASERGVPVAELLCCRPTLDAAWLYAELLEGRPTPASLPACRPLYRMSRHAR